MPSEPECWRGYHRSSRRHTWREVARADSEGACWDRVLACMERERNGEWLVTDRDPRDGDHERRG